MRTIIIFLLLIPLLSYSQGLKGLITNINGDPIPYATLFVKEVSMGTTSNIEGNYEIHLPPGRYTIQFRSMGYKLDEQEIEIDATTTVRNIVLHEQVFHLHEVNVYAGNEDPAYPIMRKALSMAPYFRNQVKKYQADVYLKGTAKLEKVPKLLKKSLKVGVNGQILKEGELFVNENFSQIEFNAPDQYKQKVVSSNSSIIDNATQAFDIGLITASVYDPEMDVVVMPFSPQTFSHYNFRYEGAFTEGKHLINKIKMIPKRKSRLLLSGNLYIIDGLWCLQRVEFVTDQNFGHIEASIEFAEIRDKAWLPVSHKISIDGSMMGIKAKANYTSSVKYLLIAMNEILPVPSLIEKFEEERVVEEAFLQELTARQKKIETMLKKEDLSNRETIKLARLMEQEAREINKPAEEGNRYEIKNSYEIERSDSATRRDTLYCASLRPNPLTSEEEKSYQLARLNAPKPQIDTLPQKKKRFQALRLIKGNQFKFNNDSIRLTYNGLIGSRLLTFNPVEGLKYRQEATVYQLLPKGRIFSASLGLGYAFGPNQFQWAHHGGWRYAPGRMGAVNWSIGSNSSDYLGSDGVAPIINTVASLFFKANFSRYQHQEFLRISNQIEVVNGLLLHTRLEYYHRKNPEVSTQYSFFRKERNYAANEIFDFEGNNLTPSENRSTLLTLSAEYTPQRYFRMHKGVKVPMRSSWPTFTLTYKKGIPTLLGSNANWDYAELKVEQRKKMGI